MFTPAISTVISINKRTQLNMNINGLTCPRIVFVCIYIYIYIYIYTHTHTYTRMRRITTFRLTTDCKYDGGPIIL